jgi:hypothetical protein
LKLAVNYSVIAYAIVNQRQKKADGQATESSNIDVLEARHLKKKRRKIDSGLVDCFRLTCSAAATSINVNCDRLFIHQNIFPITWMTGEAMI